MSRDLALSAFAVCPVGRGYGYVFFEAAARPVVWAVRHLRMRCGQRNAAAMVEIESLLDRYQPDEVVLEEWAPGSDRRSTRIQRLHQSIAHAAQTRGIGVSRLTKKNVRAVFRSVGAVTRHEVAQTVARQFPGIAHRLPAKRRIWDSEKAISSLFSAAALGIAFYGTPDQDNDGLILSPYYLPGAGPL
jgi:Holliday junction resolvasome RuvABC endonuclease subunit